MATKEINKAKAAKCKSSAEKGTSPSLLAASISPLAPITLAKLPPLAGVRLATAETGIN